jgi:hypothetical protein
MCFCLKPWANLVLLAVLGVCLTLVTLIIVRQGEMNAQRGNSAGTLDSCDGTPGISKEDHKFLADLLQQQNQDNERQTDALAASGQNFAKTESDAKPVPRAVLVGNSSKVKRAQLVIKGQYRWPSD